MNKISRLLFFSMALSSLTTGCSDEEKYKAMAEKYTDSKVEYEKHKLMSPAFWDKTGQTETIVISTHG